MAKKNGPNYINLNNHRYTKAELYVEIYIFQNVQRLKDKYKSK